MYMQQQTVKTGPARHPVNCLTKISYKIRKAYTWQIINIQIRKQSITLSILIHVHAHIEDYTHYHISCLVNKLENHKRLGKNSRYLQIHGIFTLHGQYFVD